MPVRVDVPERRAFGQVVRAKEGGVDHARRFAYALDDQVMERETGDALGEQREDHVSTVAVGESLAGRELRREAVEDPDVPFGRRELVTGTGVI